MERGIAIVVRRRDEKAAIGREGEERCEERGGTGTRREHELWGDVSLMSLSGWEGVQYYGICALFVLPACAPWKPCREEAGDGFMGFYRQHERSVPVGVAGDAIVFVAGIDKEFNDIQEAELGS